jgi:hypothetical protein
MTYDYNKEEFFGRTLFSFNKGAQDIVVAFNKETDSKYHVIVFCESGNPIENPHDIVFANTLDEITVEFCNGHDLTLEVAAF